MAIFDVKYFPNGITSRIKDGHIIDLCKTSFKLATPVSKTIPPSSHL